MIHRLLAAILILSISGCSFHQGQGAGSGPGYNYELLGMIPESEHRAKLTACSEYLKAEGFLVETSDYFLTVKTDSKRIGPKYWNPTNEKWIVSYQIKMQLFSRSGDMLFWEFAPLISGSRSGREDRRFSEGDFSDIDSEIRVIRMDLLKILKINEA